MKRKLLALLLAGLLCLGLVPPAFAAVEELVTLRVDDVAAYCGDEGIYTVRGGGLYGFYRVDGSVLLEPAYAAVGPFSGGMAAVSLAGEWSEDSRDGAARFNGGRFGYVGTDGVLVIPMQYRQAFPFVEDRAFAVDLSGELVMLDRGGRVVASFPEADLREDESIRFSEGLAVIPVRGETDEESGGEVSPAYLVVDISGREVCTLTDAYVDFMGGYHDGLIAAADAGEWTAYGPEGRRFTAAPGSWGYRDGLGGLAIDFQYEAAEPFSEGLAAVRTEEGYGFVDPAGEMIVPAEYEEAEPFTNGVGAVCADGKWAYVDNAGRVFTGFSYDGTGLFREGIALVQDRGRLRAVNSRGINLFSVEAVESPGFSGGVAAVRQADGLWGICGTNGELLVPFEYEEAYHWDGYLWLKRGELWRVYSTQDVIEARQAAPGGEAAEVGSFLDVPADSWYAVPVMWATDHDVITGTGGGLFSPERLCTRGEIISFLWRAMGRPEPEGGNPFTDVSASHYYYQAALWGYENGLLEGETFNAAEQCSRSEALTYLWRLEGCPVGRTPIFFTDVAVDCAYAQAVSWAVGAGITGGNGGGTFSPDEICSRAQIVTFLYRYVVLPED